LDLRGCKLNDLASLGFVGILSHLRYLGLPSTKGVGPIQLPAEIGKLRFLQMMDLYETRVEELPPSVIIGLGQLMCLRCYGRHGTRLPDGLKKLASLEVLEGLIVASKCIAEELGHLTQLRVLDVKVIYAEEANDDGWAAFIKAQLESLGKLTKIECLRISVNFDAAILDGSMTEPQPLGNLRKLHIGGFNDVLRMPTWIRPAWLPALSYLDIWVKHERRDDIQVLGTLPCLGHLRFSARVAAEERSAVGADAFPRLVICVFRTRDTIMGPCTFPRGAMPMLQDYSFWIGGFELLKSVAVEDMGLGLGHLPSLRSVTLIHCWKANSYRVKRVREKLEQEAAVHPNHPLRIRCRPCYIMDKTITDIPKVAWWATRVITGPDRKVEYEFVYYN